MVNSIKRQRELKSEQTMNLAEHKQYPGMFYLQWPDGSMSDDFYNKSWANQHRGDMQESIDRGMPVKGPEKVAGAFK